MHLDDGEIQRLIDAEMPPASTAEARAHLERCSECRAREAAAEQEDAWVLGRLRALDHPAPPVRVETVTSRINRRGLGWGRWAATILVILGGAGVAYAAPGSPLPRLVVRLSAWLAGRQRPAVNPASGETTGITAGTALAPGNSLQIVFSAEQPGAFAVVSLTGDTLVQVRVIDSENSARAGRRPGASAFTVHPDRISIDNAGSTARFEVDIPSSARHVEILIGDRRILSSDSGKVVSDTPRDPDSKYRLALFRPRR